MFPGLRAINMSTNALTGTIPPQFNQTGIFSGSPIFLLSGRPLQQIFDLSFNKLTGSLPDFLSSQSVPPWTAGGIYLEVIPPPPPPPKRKDVLIDFITSEKKF